MPKKAFSPTLLLLFATLNQLVLEATALNNFEQFDICAHRAVFLSDDDLCETAHRSLSEHIRWAVIGRISDSLLRGHVVAVNSILEHRQKGTELRSDTRLLLRNYIALSKSGIFMNDQVASL